MAETKVAKCAHPGCTCPVAKGSKVLQSLLRKLGKPNVNRLQLWAYGVCYWASGRGSGSSRVSGGYPS